MMRWVSSPSALLSRAAPEPMPPSCSSPMRTARAMQGACWSTTTRSDSPRSIGQSVPRSDELGCGIGGLFHLPQEAQRGGTDQVEAEQAEGASGGAVADGGTVTDEEEATHVGAGLRLGLGGAGFSLWPGEGDPYGADWL